MWQSLLITITSNLIGIWNLLFPGDFGIFSPLTHKKGVVIGLTDKVFKLSYPRFHEKNFKLIFDILLNNGYPPNFIFTAVTNRIKSLIHNNFAFPSTPISFPSPSPAPSFFVIPYIRGVSEQFKDIAAKLNKSLAFVVLNKLNRFMQNAQGSFTDRKSFKCCV